ncbi:MFS transporter [Paraburkholderia sp. J10-1]|uniref:MFS transporter n=1 Tax=Paraburkholderia sp. J10-1 TaxID=2805430 RepID=UPI002AB619E5|nr:MFS transporter [Paraburkholderia sp. J10-1]
MTDATGENVRLSRSSIAALLVAHCAGMIDLVALPLWIGVLIAQYRFDPQQAGGVVTLFLAGVVVASAVTAPLFARAKVRLMVPAGFAAAGVLFGVCASVFVFPAIAGLHFLAGLCVGVSLSLTHGTMGRTGNPHRLFGSAMAAMGAFGLVFLFVAGAILKLGGPGALFYLFLAVMLVATLVTVRAFPVRSGASNATPEATGKMPRIVWFGVLGIVCMNLVQSMVFSFLERIGVARGIAQEHIVLLLMLVGVANVITSVIAALSERRFNPRTVLFLGPVCQGGFAAIVTLGASIPAYFGAAVLFVSCLVMAHTFVFGIIAKLDCSGRAVAATPAMMMIGSALGPILAGTLVKVVGFSGLGFAAIAVDGVAMLVLAALALSVAHRSSGTAPAMSGSG